MHVYTSFCYRFRVKNKRKSQNGFSFLLYIYIYIYILRRFIIGSSFTCHYTKHRQKYADDVMLIINFSVQQKLTENNNIMGGYM